MLETASSSLCEEVLQEDLIQFHDEGMKLASIFQPDLMDITNIDSHRLRVCAGRAADAVAHRYSNRVGIHGLMVERANQNELGFAAIALELEHAETSRGWWIL